MKCIRNIKISKTGEFGAVIRGSYNGCPVAIKSIGLAGLSASIHQKRPIMCQRDLLYIKRGLVRSRCYSKHRSCRSLPSSYYVIIFIVVMRSLLLSVRSAHWQISLSFHVDILPTHHIYIYILLTGGAARYKCIPDWGGWTVQLLVKSVSLSYIQTHELSSLSLTE